MRTRFRFHAIPLILGVLSFGFTFAQADQAAPRYARLTILHTNDTHGHLFPFQYNGEKDTGGAARRAGLIASIRGEGGDSVLLLDAGDIFTRGPLAPKFKGQPDIDVMNAMDYDVATFGNNEFKGAAGAAGFPILLQRVKQAEFPFVCANATYADSGKPIAPPYTIINRAGLRIGVFGLTAPRVATYEQAAGLKIEDPLEAAKRIVPALKEQADVVVALTHIGYDLDKVLAAAVPDIDIIVGGDSHTWVFQPEVVSRPGSRTAFWVGGPVLVQDGEWGKRLGRVDTILHLASGHDYQVMSVKGELVPIDRRIQPDSRVTGILKRYTSSYGAPVGRSAKAVSKDDAALWVGDVYRSVSGAELGVVPTGTIEAGIPEGDVTAFDLMCVMPSDSQLMTAKVNGQALLTILADQAYTIAGAELTGPGAGTVNGRQIEPGAVYTVCCSEHVIDKYVLADGRLIGRTVQEALRQYVRGKAGN